MRGSRSSFRLTTDTSLIDLSSATSDLGRVRTPVPATANAGASPDPPLVGVPARTSPSVPNGRVLVVEDDPKFAAVLHRHLVASGIRSCQAASGDTALRSVRDADVVAVLLDIMIPHPDGIEVCRQLRRDRWTGLIVAMSARTGPIHEAAIRDAGADVFLAKPFPLEELSRALTGLALDGRGAS